MSIEWEGVLDFLNVRYDSRSLPQTVECPFCGTARMTIYEDSISGGQWHYCFECGGCGDALDLVQDLYSLAPNEAAKILFNEGLIRIDGSELEVKLSKHLNSYVRQRAAANELWEKAQQGLPSNRTQAIRYLRYELSLRFSGSRKRWQEGLGKLVGAIPHVEAEACFAPHLKNRSKAANAGKGTSRIFHGRNWKDVLVVPHFLLPGLISSFLFVGREGNPNKDFVRKIVYGRKNREVGLSGLSQALVASERWDNRILVTANPMLELYLQFRQARMSSRLLPIISWSDSNKYPTRHAWDALAGKHLTFWVENPTPRELERAAIMDANVASNGPYSDAKVALKEYLKDMGSAEDFIAKTFDQGRSWKTAVGSMMTRMSGTDAQQFMELLSERGISRDSIWESLHYDVKGFLNRGDKLHGHRVAHLDPHKFVEMNDKWYRVRDGHGNLLLISEAVIVVEDIIYQASSDRIFYRGVIRCRGQEIPFCLPKSKIAEKSLNWLNDILIQNGQLPVARPSVNVNFMDVAMMFRTPKNVTAVDKVGWNGSKDRFVFPMYQVDTQGRIFNHDSNLFTDRVPGGSLRSCPDFGSDDISTIESSFPSTYWEFLVFLFHNALAPVHGEKKKGLAVVGSYELIDKLTRRSLDCEVLAGNSVLPEREMQHDFPVVVRYSRPYMEEWLPNEREREHNSVMQTTYLQSLGLASQGNWIPTKISDDQPMLPRELCLKLVHAYVRDVCSRGGRIRTSFPLWLKVRDDLDWFLHRLGCRQGLVKECVDNVSPDPLAAAGNWLVKFLAEAYDLGRMDITNQSYRTASPSLTFDESCDDLSLSRADLGKLFLGCRLQEPDPEWVTAILKSCKVLKGTLGSGQILGWVLDSRLFSHKLNQAL